MTHGRRLHAARYLRALASVETAIALNRYEDARRILEGIDQHTARELAAELECFVTRLPPTGAVRGIRSGRDLLAAPVSFYPESLRA